MTTISKEELRVLFRKEIEGLLNLGKFNEADRNKLKLYCFASLDETLNNVRLIKLDDLVEGK